MYHSVLQKGGTAYTISADMLESDFKYIKEKGYNTVTVNEVIAFTEGKGTLPEKPIMLTFDDGYYNNFVYVIPLLEKYDFKCVTAIVGSFSNSKDNREGKKQSLSYSHMNKYQIKEAVKSGRVEIQHHSYSLHSYGKARKGMRINKGESYEDSVYSLCMQRERTVNAEVTYPLYPFFGETSRKIAAAKGCRAGITSDGRTCSRCTYPWRGWPHGCLPGFSPGSSSPRSRNGGRTAGRYKRCTCWHGCS